MENFNLKGVRLSRNKKSWRLCHLKGCGRKAYFKVGMVTTIGKTLAKASEKPSMWDGEGNKGITYPDGNYGSYCSFDCLRRQILEYVFSAKMKMTPTIKDFLAQTEANLGDYEYLCDRNNANFDISDLGPGHSNYFKLSPNGDDNYPYLLEVITTDRSNLVGFNRDGAKELIEALQNLIDNEDKFTAERDYMRNKRKKK